MNKEALITKMLSAFNRPLATAATLQKRGMQLIPHYAVRNEKEAAYVCTCCGKKTNVEVNEGCVGICENCGTPVKRTTGKYRYDSLWLFLPGYEPMNKAERGSYFKFSQEIKADGTIRHNLSELARYMITPNGTKYYFTRETCDGKWNTGKKPHFVRSCSGWEERKDWCEQNYILPRQYAGYLMKKFTFIKDLGITAKNGIWKDNTRDIWAYLKEPYSPYKGGRNMGVLDFMEEETPDCALLQKLVKYKLNSLFYAALCGNPIKGTAAAGNTARTLLGLSVSEYNAFNALGRTTYAYQQIRESRKNHFCFEVYDPVFLHMAREKARGELQKKGLSLNLLEMIPTKSNKVGYVYYNAEKKGSTVVLKEHAYVYESKAWFERNNGSWIKAGFFGVPVISNKAFTALFPEVPAEILTARRKRYMAMNPNLVQKAVIWEKLRNAGFTTLAEEFLHHISQDNDFEWETGNVANGRLYSFMGIPKRAFNYIKVFRSSLTIETLREMQKSFCHYPLMDIKDWEDFSLVYHTGIPEGLCQEKKLHDTVQYLKAYYLTHKKAIIVGEYVQHIKNAKLLYNGKIPKTVAFPEDFHHCQLTIHDQAEQVQDKNKAAAMKKIAEALRNDRSVTRFFQKNKKYLIYVPESPKDLRREGEQLHNCLRTFDNRVAEGNTSVFFIRMADAPDQAFAAFEVCDGKLVQIHSAFNRNVDDEVTEFANAFINVLNKNAFDPRKIVAA